MKILKKILSFVLIVSVVCSIVCVNSNAQEFEEHTSCVKEHFEWVQNIGSNRYPRNPIGSCSYVAMSLLLSFYDAYWHDDFLPDIYETVGRFNVTTGNIESEFHFKLENSEWNALVNNENLDEKSDIAKEKYAQFIEDNANEYLQMYLLDLAIDAGYHNNELVYGLQAYEIVDFLEYYLYEVCNFTAEQVIVNKESAILPSGRDTLYDKAEELINSGVPVIYGGTSIDVDGVDWISDSPIEMEGHALFGYDLTSDGNDIVLSKCWNGHATTTFNTTDYEYRASIIWIEINEEALPHVCSDSYIETGVDDGDGLCTCEIFSEHPEHTHRDSGLSLRYDSLKHLYSCYCGQIVSYPHTYSFTYLDSNYHSAVCSCNYTSAMPHDFTYASINSLYHSATCTTCGYTYTEMHPGANAVNKPRLCSKCQYVFVPFEPWGDNAPPTETD